MATAAFHGIRAEVTTSGDLVPYQGPGNVVDAGVVKSTRRVHLVRAVPQNLTDGIGVNESGNHNVASEAVERVT